MGLISFEYQDHFADLVKLFESEKILVTSYNSLQIEESGKFREFGLFSFLMMVCTNIFRKNVYVLTNPEFWKSSCIIFFPDTSKRSPLNFDQESFYQEIKLGAELLSKTEKAIICDNVDCEGIAINADELKTWADYYNFALKNDKNFYGLGGSGIKMEVSFSLIETLLTGVPKSDEQQITTFFDIYLSILVAGHYGDSGLYSANTHLEKPFKSYELDCLYIKAEDDKKLKDCDLAQDISRMIAIETTSMGRLDNVSLNENDFTAKNHFETQSQGVKQISIDDRSFYFKPYAKDNFSNKILTYKAMSNIGVKKFAYILILLKDGLTSKQEEFLKKESTATVAYNLLNSNGLEVIELNCNGDENYLQSALTKHPIDLDSLSSGYNKIIEKVAEVLKKYE